jgi:hypothetical protein
VFQGGGVLEAIESVCSPVREFDTLEDLASLVDNSLLRRVEPENGEPRFVMLETIKGYASERRWPSTATPGKWKLHTAVRWRSWRGNESCPSFFRSFAGWSSFDNYRAEFEKGGSGRA